MNTTDVLRRAAN